MSIEELSSEKEGSPIAQELLRMAEVDQEMRHKALENDDAWDSEVDKQNTERLKQIIAEIGWPTASKVGAEAANKAWLLAQHADKDPEFQRECLRLMEEAGEGEVNKSDVAFLIDRVFVNSGHEQLYGTQWFENEAGEYGPRPIENQDELDKRREEMGLGPFSEYESHIRQKYEPYNEK